MFTRVVFDLTKEKYYIYGTSMLEPELYAPRVRMADLWLLLATLSLKRIKVFFNPQSKSQNQIAKIRTETLSETCREREPIMKGKASFSRDTIP